MIVKKDSRKFELVVSEFVVGSGEQDDAKSKQIWSPLFGTVS